MTDEPARDSPAHRVRRLLARHLMGSGVELGALHSPYPAHLTGIQRIFVDRWTPEEARALFPELGTKAEFVAPDLAVDLNVEGLAPLQDQSQDFVVASHVLEHLANPLAVLVEMHRVLRPGGTALLLLPDKRRTSDFKRDVTTLDHLVGEYESGVKEVDDAHLLEYAEKVQAYVPGSPGEREHLDQLARRSIHVHTFTEESFFELLVYATEHLDCRFELLDAVRAEDIPAVEFGHVLRRSTSDLPADVLAKRLREQREVLLSVRSVAAGDQSVEEKNLADARAELAVVRGQLAAALDVADRRKQRIVQLQARLARHEAVLRPLRRTPLAPAFRAARRALAQRRAAGG